MSLIKIEKLNKYYGRKTHVLKDISLELPTTGLVCLLGESGSGKTTLLNTVGCLDSFRPGKIHVMNRVLRGRIDRKAEYVRNEGYGYMFQNYFLLQERTVYDNLMLALSLYDISDKEKEERIDYVLDAVELTRFRKREVSKLSGGQQQRVAIARALIKTSSVIFADEPTGNLDEANTMLIMSILKKVSRSCLVLLATHEKRIAEFFADRIISICDGVIQSDKETEKSDRYRYSDDSSLYLDEYERHCSGDDVFTADYYGKDSMKITLVNDRGRLYVSAPDGVKIEVVNALSGVKIKSGPRPEAKRSAIDSLAYDLPRIKSRKHGRLPFRELANMALGGIRGMGRRLVVPVATMIATAVLCMLAVSDVLTLANIDPEDFITTDSRLLQITVKPADYVKSNEIQEQLTAVLGQLRTEIPECELYAEYNVEFFFSYSGFTQIDKLSDVLYSFSVVPMKLFGDAVLLEGRMPQGPDEVVVDRWVLEAFMERKTTLSQSITDIKQFLGQHFTMSGKDYLLTIVGICDSGQPDVYVDTIGGLSYCIAGNPVGSLSTLQATYPGQFDDVVLEKGQCLMNEQRLHYATNKGEYHSGVGASYEIIDKFPREFPAVFVVSDDSAEEVIFSLVTKVRSFTVFTENKQQVKDFFAKDFYKLSFSVSDLYGGRMALYENARAVRLDARLLVSGMITLISFVVLYIVMKANAIHDMPTVAVYRLLGISRGAVSSVYLIETLLLSLMTTVVATFATAGVLSALSSIESLELNFVVTLPAVCATAAALVVVNLLMGVLPIMRLLRIPPAKLAAQYDI